MAKKKARKTKAAKSTTERQDSFQNPWTGLGTSADRRRKTEPGIPILIKPDMLRSLYRAGGVARRIVDLKVQDALRHWFRISGDEGDKVKTRMEELGVQRKVASAMKEGRLFGGALLLMVFDDGDNLAAPLNVNRKNKLQSLVVLNRSRIVVTPQDLQIDVTKPGYLEPRQYTVTPILGGTQFKLDASRVIRFDGDELPWEDYQVNQYWHDSVLQSAYEPLRQLGAVLDSCEFITEQFVLNVFKMSGLADVLRGPGGKGVVQNRMDALDRSLHVANTFLCDMTEEFTKVVSSVSGLSELVDQFMISLCSATGYPATKLFGRSPAGMNATGESDMAMYDDDIVAIQENDLRMKLEPLIRAVWNSIGAEPETWSIVWKPLRQPTPEGVANLYKMTAEADQAYLTNQVLTPEQIEKHRFVGDTYNPAPPVFTEEEWEESQAQREEDAALELEQMRAMQARLANGQAGNEPPQEGQQDPDAQGDEGADADEDGDDEE